jgi:hypothetical protein
VTDKSENKFLKFYLMTAVKPQINTSNPDAIAYQTEELGFTILGGIRLDGLDRMRVTLKVEVLNRKFRHYLDHPDIAGLVIRQNLDLYNHHQVEKLCRLIADRLEVGLTPVVQALGEITDQLELYRLQQLETRRQEQEKPLRALTEAEQQAAMPFLQQPDLLQSTNDIIGKSGMVGEELNRLIMYLIFISRKTSRPLHVISFGSSGTGKSHLQEKIGDLMPDEDKIEITALTENAFYYFDKGELDHKLILIEDRTWTAYGLRCILYGSCKASSVSVKPLPSRTVTAIPKRYI